MVKVNHSLVCGRCGTSVYAEDRFCGVCGANISADGQYAILAHEGLGHGHASESTPAIRGRRKKLVLSVVAMLLVLLLVGTGTVTYAAFDPTVNLLGWTGAWFSNIEDDAPAEGGSEENPPSADPEGTLESTTTTVSVSPDSSPDPAFDKLLPTLKQRTKAPIMLPAKLPEKLKHVAVDANSQGNKYEILFFRNPPKNVVQRYVRAEVYGTLRTYPEAESKSNEYFEATKTEEVGLPDDTKATLRYLEPVREQGGTQGPYWEGKFDRYRTTYALTITSDDVTEDEARRALSTMVEVSQKEVAGGEIRTEEELVRAVEEYYEDVDREDWDYTWEKLDPATKRSFTKEEWNQKNQWFADNDPRELRSTDVEKTDIIGNSAEVRVKRTFEDGSSQVRLTYFVFDDRGWKHRFGQEEHDLFMPDASFEEFVKAQQGTSSRR